MKDVQLLTYSSCTLPSLAGVYGCRDNEGGVEVEFNLEAIILGLYIELENNVYDTGWCLYGRTLVRSRSSPSERCS